MAKRTYIKGKSVNDLLNMDYNEWIGLSESDLRQVVTRIADAANKRLKRLKRLGETKTPATEQAKRGGGKFSTKGKGLNELRKEYVRVRAFIQNPTSSISGYKKLRKEFEQKGGEIPETLFGDFWRLYHALEELDPHFKSLPPSDKMKLIQEELDEHPNYSFEEHIKSLTNRMRNEYEEIQAERNAVDFSAFFETE